MTAAIRLSPAVEGALARFRGALQHRFGDRLRELVLFGSYARGDAHEDSDVDVLVSIEGLTGAERRTVIDTVYFEGRAKDETIGLSPLAFSTEETERHRSGGRRLFQDIAREGVRL